MYLISFDTYSSNKNSQNNAYKNGLETLGLTKLDQPTQVNLFIRQRITADFFLNKVQVLDSQKENI